MGRTNGGVLNANEDGARNFPAPHGSASMAEMFSPPHWPGGKHPPRTGGESQDPGDVARSRGLEIPITRSPGNTANRG